LGRVLRKDMKGLQALVQEKAKEKRQGAPIENSMNAANLLRDGEYSNHRTRVRERGYT